MAISNNIYSDINNFLYFIGKDAIESSEET